MQLNLIYEQYNCMIFINDTLSHATSRGGHLSLQAHSVEEWRQPELAQSISVQPWGVLKLKRSKLKGRNIFISLLKTVMESAI